MIDEPEIEARIVRDQRRIADEFEQFLAAFVEEGLVGQERARPMHRFGFARHRPAGIEIGVEGLAGLDPIEHFDAADLDQCGRRRPG